MTMNKYQEAQLSLIEKIIPKIQEFVDRNITGEKAMTAAQVAEGFLKLNPQKLSVEDFVKSFRIAVGEGRIKGIEGAKRAGYRRIGSISVTAVDASLNAFTPYVDRVQTIIDKYIHGRNKLTSQAIYQKFLAEYDNDCKLNEESFIKGFRIALSRGNLKRITGAGPAGYKHVEEIDEEDEDTSESEEQPMQEISTYGCEITIDDTHRIVGIDDKNWAYQIKRGNTWCNTAYFGNVRAMVSSMAKKLVDDKLKSLDKFDFNSFDKKLTELECILVNILNKAIVNK